MSHRTNWKVLRNCDPIPGDVPGIRDAAAHYDKIRAALETARNRLDDIITRRFSDSMISESVDKLRDEAKTVRDGLSGISGRYSVAARELYTYADALDRAQTAADRAEGDAQNAQAAIDQAQQQINTYRPKVDGLATTKRTYDRYSGDPAKAPSQSVVDANQRDLSRYTALLTDANGDLKRAESAKADASHRLDLAIRDRDWAAETAANIIRAQIRGDGQSDTWWDDWGAKVVDFITSIAVDFGKAVVDAAKALADITTALIDMGVAAWELKHGNIDLAEFNRRFSAAADKVFESVATIAKSVSTICGTLALVLAFTPAGPILSAIATGAGLVHLATEGALAVTDAIGGDPARLERFATTLVATGLTFVAGKALGSLSFSSKYSVFTQSTTIAQGEARLKGMEVVADVAKTYMGTGVDWGKENIQRNLGIAEPSPTGLAKSWDPYFSKVERNEALTEANRSAIVTTALSKVTKPVVQFTVPCFQVPQISPLVTQGAGGGGGGGGW